MKVTTDEAKAIKRFRNSADSQIIKAVLLRGLKVAQDKFEDETFSGDNQLRVKIHRDVLRILFDEELVRG